MQKFAAVFVLVLVAFVGSSWAATTFVDQLENPDHPGQCFDTATRTHYTVGAKWQTDGQCNQNTCNRGTAARTMSIRSVHCGEVALPRPGCRASPENPTRSYPDCCGKAVCPK